MELTNLLPLAERYLRLRRSQYAPAVELEAISRWRIKAILRVAHEIPFYRERFRAIADSAELSAYPVLARSEIPALNQSVRQRSAGIAFFHDNSSGSTGRPVEFLFDTNHQSGRYAARFRYLRANGWNPLKRTAWLMAFTSEPGESPEGWLIKSRLRFGSHFLDLIFRPFDEQLDALAALRPEFLYTMPSNLDGLLQALERRPGSLTSLRCIFTGGEVLDDSIRERTRKLLGVEIRDNYGSTEGFIAWQCGSGSYHVNAEHVMVEIVDENNRPVKPGAMGRILVTTLENRLMPLIRYEIGDYAIASGDECGCGRTLSLIGRVIGRGINLFRMPDGRRVSPWPLVGPLKDCAAIRQFQIVQEAHRRYLVRYVADRELDREEQTRISTSFAAILEIDATVSFDRRDSIPRTSGGKFMTALSLVDTEVTGSRDSQAAPGV
jgi:phenylacetate-CoA ligase